MKDIVLLAWRSLYNYLHVSGLGRNETINCQGRGNILVEEVILMTSHIDVPVQTSLSNKHWISLKSDAGILGVWLQNQGRHILLFFHRSCHVPDFPSQHNLPNSTFAITKIFSLEKLLIQHGHSTLINFFHPASTISLSCISLAGILSLHIQSTGKNRLPSRKIRLPSRLEKDHKTPNWRSPQPRLAPPSSRLYP